MSTVSGAVGTVIRPVIGITTRRMDTETLRLDVVDRAYGDAIGRAGGTAHLLPRPSGPMAGSQLAGVDGLLLTGGGDVDPAQYGQVRSAEVGGMDSDRDDWELQLVRQAFDLAMPVLGVCRGCQVLNVACGGTLIQHLPDRTSLPHLVVARQSEAHAVHIEPHSELFAVQGTDIIGTNSVHHQAVDSIGAGLRATAWAEDGTVEAIERLTSPAIGVQWHPENLLDRPAHVAIFVWLVERAARWQGHDQSDATGEIPSRPGSNA
jgi:putative glutamine amidotransferase